MTAFFMQVCGDLDLSRAHHFDSAKRDSPVASAQARPSHVGKTPEAGDFPLRRADELRAREHGKGALPLRAQQPGMVMVNLPTAGVDYHVPFGGRKGSSYGPREQGRYAAEFYTTVKTAYTQA